MTLSYDRDADVLYVTFERLPGQQCVYLENANGDVLRLDKNSRKVIGVTMPHFSKRASKHPLSIPEIGPVPFNQLAEELV